MFLIKADKREFSTTNPILFYLALDGTSYATPIDIRFLQNLISKQEFTACNPLELVAQDDRYAAITKNTAILADSSNHEYYRHIK